MKGWKRLTASLMTAATILSNTSAVTVTAADVEAEPSASIEAAASNDADVEEADTSDGFFGSTETSNDAQASEGNQEGNIDSGEGSENESGTQQENIWNYKLALKWTNESSNDVKRSITEGTGHGSDSSIQATLTVSTQRHYPAGELEIRLPAYLFDKVGTTNDNNATKTAVVGLGTPSDPGSGRFVYYIDSDTNEIVIYNINQIDDSINVEIPIQYFYQSYLTQDLAKTTVTAKGKGQYTGQETAEELSSETLSLTLDTGLTMDDGYILASEQLNAWNSSSNEWLAAISASTPSWFDTENYNYFLYYPGGVSSSSKITITDAQVYQFSSTITPSDNGTVMGTYLKATPIINGVSMGDSATSTTDFIAGSSGEVIVSFDEGKTARALNNKLLPYSYTNNVQIAYVVAYPITDEQRKAETMGDTTGSKTYETDYSVTQTYSATASQTHDNDKVENVDFNDVAAATAKGNAHYKSFTFAYDGNVYSGGKSDLGASKATRYRGLDTVDLLGYDSDVYVAYESYFDVYGYDGVNFDGTYHYEHIDDTVAISYKDKNDQTIRKILTSDDFAFTDFVTVDIVSNYVDKSTGEALTTYPKASCIL